MAKIVDKVFPIIVLFLLIGIYLGYSTIALCLLVLLLRMISSDRHTVGVFLLLYSGSLCGTIRYFFPFLPLYGIVMEFLGVALLWDRVRDLFRHHSNTFVYLLAVFAVFLVFYLRAEHTPYANSKIVGIIEKGTMMAFGYYAMITSKRVSSEKLLHLLLIGTIVYIACSLLYLNTSAGSLFDYNWLRAALELRAYQDQELTIINYQQVSMMALFGIAIFLSQKQIKLGPAIFYIVISTQLILTGGARQAILGLLVVLILRFVFFNGRCSSIRLPSIFVAAMLVVAVASIVLRMNIASIDSMVDSGSDDRILIYLDCLRIFKDYPILGVGLGGFPLYTIMDVPWPHNFILELLCECGIVGTVLLFLIVIHYWRTQAVSLHVTTRSNCYFFLIVSALFVRVLFSSDLTESIQLFSCLFVVTSQNYSIPCSTTQS